jgi:ribose 5-phosphate isomerase B
MIIIKIYIGGDHQGNKIIPSILEYAKEKGYDFCESSLPHNETDDYPDFAYDVCKKVLKENTLGILVCGSGIGISIAANKIKGIRCARVFDKNDAYTCKNHNGANVIAFSANLDINTIKEIIDTFISTPKPTEERHLRRIEKINQIEAGTYEL